MIRRLDDGCMIVNLGKTQIGLSYDVPIAFKRSRTLFVSNIDHVHSVLLRNSIRHLLIKEVDQEWLEQEIKSLGH